ncbi:HNH endonuclease [Mycobacterium sherrisii]|uniref:HNH endonuclease n=1 Tax=Mycobacterium sherrisii TaxID=243061 RepID=UPI002DDD53E1|nr:HNH endonuclease [Mycobacterium sherrisii]MEC4763813.1 HNH endonuclease [Mycobacterium sherrisii]
MAKGTCSIVEDGVRCDKPVKRRGWCSKHLMRWYRHGDPLHSAFASTDEGRFWAKVNKNGPIHPRLGTSCWPWTGAKGRCGTAVSNAYYGSLCVGGKTVHAHRYSYALALSETIFAPWLPLAKGVVIDHRCHDSLCVRPSHLRATTQKKNSENRNGLDRNNTSGVRGVFWDKRNNRWIAKVGHNGKQIHVGCFTDKADAEAARVAKANEVFTHNDVERASAIKRG